MANLVIVAIPAEDDYVWKLSSEKVPHCTLVFMGDAASNQNVLKIQQFLEHAVNILELGPFGLEVDHRGELGPDNADVLFFRKDWSGKRLAEFRGQLLKNEPIRNAYESAPQHDLYPDGWTPHLTMGYPRTPAREDKRDFPGIRWVEFDRVALWYGNYEGPEYRLQYSYDLAEVGMSAQAGEEFISHHGVKGMRWGQRKDRAAPAALSATAESIVKNPKNRKTSIKTAGGQNHPATEDAINAALAKQKLKKSGHHALTNAELQELATRLNLEQQVTSLIKRQPDRPAKALVKAVVKDPARAQRKVQETSEAGKNLVRVGKVGKVVVKRKLASRR